jgi:hypothetical protein
METRNVKISIQTATRWFNGTDNELKELALTTYPELAKKELPKSWRELRNIKGYYVDTASVVDIVDGVTYEDNKNIFATKEQAEASIALAQLSQLRKAYRYGWMPDWTDNDEFKYCIEFCQNKIYKDAYTATSHFLSFQDEKTRDLFLENFKELIETAKPLMS